MKIILGIIGFVCLIGMFLAFIPLLGWLNWLVIPFAIIGLIIGFLSNIESSNKIFKIVIIVGVIRLILGGGLL
jgi:hypothetical protein